MNFNKHYDLIGKHAFLGASNYHWLRYDKDKLIATYRNKLAVKRGTELHDFAQRAITLKRKMPRNSETVNRYINDAIGFRLHPEQPLMYSDICFGTADAIGYDERTNFVRIHDLKTGQTPASMDQLLIYLAMFCLEYGIDPEDIKAELRIYQNDDVDILNPTADDLMPVVETMVESEECISQLILEEGE